MVPSQGLQVGGPRRVRLNFFCLRTAESSESAGELEALSPPALELEAPSPQSVECLDIGLASAAVNDLRVSLRRLRLVVDRDAVKSNQLQRSKLPALEVQVGARSPKPASRRKAPPTTQSAWLKSYK